MQIITIYAIVQFVTGQLTRFNENDLVDPSFLDSLKKAQSVFDQECFTKVAAMMACCLLSATIL